MFLGVDGGGTKTAFCLITPAGELVAEATAPSSYYLPHGIDLVARVVDQGVGQVCARAGITPGQVRRAFFGLPAYGEVSADVPALDVLPRAVLGHDRYDCGNDMICGWAGSLGARDGINVVCGTGSMTYGRNAGTGARVGGWGELFGDEGSGHWIAVEGLRAFTQMVDGRRQTGPLVVHLREHLGLVEDLDVVDVVLNRWRGERARVAALARPVLQAARAGDVACAEIVDRAVAALIGLVTTTRRRLGFDAGQEVAVSYSGGVFAAREVLDAFSRRLAALDDGYRLHPPLHPPVVGAALYAAELAGSPLGDGALATLRRRTGLPVTST